jgi:predicted nucleotidyltransferase
MDIKTIKQRALPVLKKHGVVRASLFGSAVRGEMKIGSDVDILVEIPAIYKGLNYFGFKGALQEELEQTLHTKVDLVEYRLIKPALKKYILPEQIQILS